MNQSLSGRKGEKSVGDNGGAGKWGQVLGSQGRPQGKTEIPKKQTEQTEQAVLC